MRKGKSVKVGVIVALLLLVVGFAAVSATLTVNGTTKFKGNADDFESNFQFVPDSDATDKATITSSTSKTGGTVEVDSTGKILEFTTPVFDTVNETATVTFHVQNGSQYQAKVSDMTCDFAESTDAALKEYIEISSNIEALKGETIAAGTEAAPAKSTNTGSVTVKLKKTYANENEASVAIKCTLTAGALEI